MAGRTITLPNGGSIVFQESNSTGDFAATIIVDDLTANRTIRIGDADGIIQGLLPGQAWPTDKGGTGLTNVPANALLVGTGQNPMGILLPPSEHDMHLHWDGVLNRLDWAPIDFSQVYESTTARNLNSTMPGVYSHKLGTELRFRNIVAGNGVNVTEQTDRIVLSFNAASTTVPVTSITGVLPPSKGGTGLSNIADKGILVGSAGGVAQIAAPSAANLYLRSNATNTGFEWSTVTLRETYGARFEYPAAKTYTINLNWAYACRVINMSHRVGAGTLTVNVMSNTTVVGPTMNVTTSKVTSDFSNVTFQPGDEIKLVVTATSNPSDFDFAFVLERL